MANGTIVNMQGITLTNGQSAKIDMSVVEGKVLDVLSTDQLGIHASAFIENPGQVKAQTVVYRTPDMIKTDVYTSNKYTSKSGAARNGDTPNSGTIKLDIDKKFSAKYYFEDFDLRGIETSAQIESILANGLQIAISARLDLEFIKGVVDHIIANKATAGKTITITDLSTTYDKDKMTENALKISDMITDVETTLAPNIVGTKALSTVSITNGKAFKRFVMNAINKAGANATDMMLAGGPATGIRGQVVLGDLFVKHLFMTRAVDTTQLTHDLLASEYDFSKFEAITMNTSAVAFAVDMLGLKTRVNADGNQEFIYKGRYGFKVLRPQLIKAVINAAL